MNRKVILFLCLTLFALLGGLIVDSYILCYLLLQFSLFLAFMNTSLGSRLVCGFLALYLGLGLLNISSYRGHTDIATIELYLISVISLIIPLILFNSSKARVLSSCHLYPVSQKFIFVITGHLILVYLALVFVYLSVGNVFFNQHLRFYIPTSMEYVIKSPLVVISVLPLFSSISSGKKFFFILACIIPSLLIGSRGTVVVAIMGFFLTKKIVDKRLATGSKSRKSGGKFFLVFFSLFAIVVVSAGFYLRRSGTGNLVDVNTLISLYFDFHSPWLYPIIPFYLAFKETVGITNMIVTQEIENYILGVPLFIADLLTVMPGENLAAGQALGSIIGRAEEGGLTPGLLGGIYIDFGVVTPIFFFGIGCVLSLSFFVARNNLWFIPVYATIIVEFLHLFHRGFLKPEYITSFFIVFFYCIAIRKWRLGKTVV